MTYTSTVDPTLLQQWFMEKMKPEAIEESLKARGLDQESIVQHLKEYRKLCCAKRQFNGFVLLGAGAFLGFVSCLLSVVNPIPSLYYAILYGLTSVALALIFWGLYLVFED